MGVRVEPELEYYSDEDYGNVKEEDEESRTPPPPPSPPKRQKSKAKSKRQNDDENANGKVEKRKKKPAKLSDADELAQFQQRIDERIATLPPPVKSSPKTPKLKKKEED